MTEGKELKECFNRIIGKISLSIAPYGYVQKRYKFVKIIPESVSIIEFQKSQQSTSIQIEFTINIAVVFPELWDPQRSLITNASSSDGHITMRIGSLFVQPDDFWWSMDCGIDESSLCADIEQKIKNYALPFLEKYPSVDKAKQMWALGNGLGSTNRQRE